MAKYLTRLQPKRFFGVVMLNVILDIVAISYIVAQPLNRTFDDILSAPAMTAKSGSRVRLEITIRNNSGDLIFLPSNRIGPQEAGISMWDENGNQLQPREQFRDKPDTIHRGIGIGIGPHESLTESVDLNRWFDLARPGQYRVQARKKVPGSNSVVESNKLTITP